jgi:SAM-dependent methyltransferase
MNKVFTDSFFSHLAELESDIYSQPADDGHIAWAKLAIDWANEMEPLEGKAVLDIGCGQGFARELFAEYRAALWAGITRGEDVPICKEKGLRIFDTDMTLSGIEVDRERGGDWNFLFARHVLEHSLFPLLTLMEWHRIAYKDASLLLVAPAPEFWGYGGLNHYSVMNHEQISSNLVRSGWRPIAQHTFTMGHSEFIKHNPDAVIEHHRPVELWYYCKRIPRGESD